MNNDTIVFCISVIILVLINGAVEINNKNRTIDCIKNTSIQNLTADEISKLCGVGK